MRGNLMRNNLYTNRIVGGSLDLSRRGIYSTATSWTDVNFVDDQFLRTLSFSGTFQSEG
ncbi:4326_t:CDS:2 [Rhizophagus irregularis]|nr:4326_t:CDS:2 [Rhizophagus irregularis]